ncbi:hypothetical protein HK107_00950 [Parvularcula sp. ZS-1/3]|uniref:VPLPA-CTERM sorting domain-containing protein n=1 Tax=Parvularcula mediterranea TaxID=2732508 RepID=A0A7Y3W3W7_9PROT|nr:hypothetical protein [Parvularcula mediterranea]NNU14889.1 hypothetical protein [Parvularcula mediterranea]
MTASLASRALAALGAMLALCLASGAFAAIATTGPTVFFSDATFVSTNGFPRTVNGTSDAPGISMEVALNGSFFESLVTSDAAGTVSFASFELLNPAGLTLLASSTVTAVDGETVLFNDLTGLETARFPFGVVLALTDLQVRSFDLFTTTFDAQFTLAAAEQVPLPAFGLAVPLLLAGFAASRKRG